jgi:HD-like signal output (HDOD) protein
MLSFFDTIAPTQFRDGAIPAFSVKVANMPNDAPLPATGSNSNLEKIIAQVDKLHSGAGVAQRILQIIRNADFNMGDVAECLEHDPALSAKILRLVNSSKYGLSVKIGKIRQAAQYLGRRSLQLVTLSFSVLDSFGKGAKGAMFLDYWRRTLTIAVAASKIAAKNKELSVDEAYTAGLMADVGTLALGQIEGDKYATMYLSHAHGEELLAAEKKLLGFTHPELASRMLERWGLPPAVIRAVERHHNPTGPREPLESVIYAAGLLSEALWTPNSPQVTAARSYLSEHFGTSLDDFIDLAMKCRTGIEESATVFGIKMGQTVDCQKLVDEARKLALETALDATLELDAIETVVSTTPS